MSDVLAIDHVIVPVADLADAAAALERKHGLGSVAGGRHPTWGTANRIVPLGDTYIELVAVVEPATASQSPFGTWIATTTPGAPLGWVVRTTAIDEIGRRLGLTVVAGSRVAPGGEQITWRTVGLDVAIRERGLPFFIEWGDGVPFPGSAQVPHPRGPARLTRLSVDADPLRLHGLLGEADLPVRVAPERMVVTIEQEGREYDLALDHAPDA